MGGNGALGRRYGCMALLVGVDGARLLIQVALRKVGQLVAEPPASARRGARLAVDALGSLLASAKVLSCQAL